MAVAADSDPECMVVAPIEVSAQVQISSDEEEAPAVSEDIDFAVIEQRLFLGKRLRKKTSMRKHIDAAQLDDLLQQAENVKFKF